jgi:hypothetical protein
MQDYVAKYKQLQNETAAADSQLTLSDMIDCPLPASISTSRSNIDSVSR